VFPSMPYMQAIGMEKDELVQALGVFFTVATVALAFNITAAGLLTAATALPGAVAMAASFAGMFIGQALRSRMHPEVFRRWFLIAMIFLGLYLAGATEFPDYERSRAWFRDNDSFRKDILKLLEKSGPLVSREIPDTCAVPWASTGWTNNRNVTQMLEFMMMRGEIAIAARVGRERVWDLAERVYPEVDVPSADEAERRRNERRLASLGIARAKGPKMPMEPVHVGNVGEPAVVEGTKGEWRVDPEALGRDFDGRTALLSPFDRLIHDRRRTEDLFEFEYVLEMYKPEAKRRWGYFALPILHDDRLVGKLDAKADRKASVLRVNAIHEDVKFTRAMAKAVQAEVDDLASWLGLDAVVR